MEIFNLTLLEMSQAIEEKKLNPIEIMESLLKRSENLEKHLNVWAFFDPENAIKNAKISHNSIKSQTPQTNSIKGIPVGIKDIFHTAGIKTEAGSKIFKDFIPEQDAHSVRLIREHGGIIMGKTITTEHAFGDPPITKNPWNSQHTPGGSSSGSAVGVAAKIFPFAVGSQTSGSVIRPAAYNGIIGLKPTFGLISRSGVFPNAKSLDTVGIFTRTIQDAALALNTMAGYDPTDEVSINKSHPNYLEGLFQKLSVPKIGIVNDFFLDNCDSEIREHNLRIINDLRYAGATIKEISMPIAVPELLDAHSKIMSFEAAEVHRTNFKLRPQDYSKDVSQVIQNGLLLNTNQYHEARQIQTQFKRSTKSIFNEIDVIISPTTSSPAPRDLNSTGDKRFQAPWTLSGLPAITFPIGTSKLGLPIGTQLIGENLSETKLLQSSLWCYETIGKNLNPDFSNFL